MLKPRPLPPAHKNQLSVPVKSFGFFSHPNKGLTPNFFRNQEVVRKRHEPKARHRGVFSPPGLRTTDHSETVTTTDDDEDDDDEHQRELASPSMTSLIHVTSRSSLTADVTEPVSVTDVRRKTPASSETEDETNLTSFLTEYPSSSRSYDGRSPSFSPVLECSKYNIIGEPRFRKKKHQRSSWTLPKLPSPRTGFVEPDDADHPKTNSIDLRSIYGTRSKVLQVPTEPKREVTVMLPPLQVGGRLREARRGCDAGSLAEKRLVMTDNQRHSVYTKLVRDHVPFPTQYKPYFRLKQRKHRFVRSLFARDDFWENHAQPVHCSRCRHASTATLHYCDVLGQRFCRFCQELSNRSFVQSYENNRLLVPSPNKSPTLDALREEPSFVGVRKVVITKRVNTGQGQGQGQGRPERQDHREDGGSAGSCEHRE